MSHNMFDYLGTDFACIPFRLDIQIERIYQGATQLHFTY